MPAFSTATARGTHGERVAAAFLHRRGYRVLQRNYRTERGEIDLICRHGRVLAFVEVRTRDRVDFGRPAETIGAAKQEALRYAAEHYLAQLDRAPIYHRFDAVEVVLTEGSPPDCLLIEDLFS